MKYDEITILPIVVLSLLKLINLAESHPKSKSIHRPILCYKNLTSSPNSDLCSKRFELYNRYCFDIELPYKTTTLPDYVPEQNFSQSDEVVNYLQRWQGVKILPKCWPFLQVALCSILMPQYDDDHGTGRGSHRISRPSVEICNDLTNKNNCKFIERHFGWPQIFNCSNTNLYSRNCVNELREFRPNHVPEVCQYPLVPSNDSKTWFKDIKGCSLHCKYPILNPSEQEYFSLIIRVICIICLVSSSLAFILFEVNVTKESPRMTEVIKRCNLCKLITYIGWLLQTLYARNIACSGSESALHGLPLAMNACVVSFSLTYISSLCYLFWYAYLGKLSYEKLIGKSKSSSGTPLDRKINPTLELLSYGLPLALFMTVALLGQIDGHGLYGICVVGQQSLIIKALFDFAPNMIGTIFGNYYFLITVIKLIQFKKSEKSSHRSTLARIMALILFSTTNVIITLANFIHSYYNHPKWLNSIDSYVACSLDLKSLYSNDDSFTDRSARQECTLEAQPMVVLYYLDTISSLALGFVIATWAWCCSNFQGFLKKLDSLLKDEMAKLISSGDTNLRRGNIHNGIDLTLSTKYGQEIELENNLEQSESGTLTSLQDCYLSRYLPTHQQQAAQPKRHQRHNWQLERTSRDVINDGRNNANHRTTIQNHGPAVPAADTSILVNDNIFVNNSWNMANQQMMGQPVNPESLDHIVPFDSLFNHFLQQHMMNLAQNQLNLGTEQQMPQPSNTNLSANPFYQMLANSVTNTNPIAVNPYLQELKNCLPNSGHSNLTDSTQPESEPKLMYGMREFK